MKKLSITMLIALTTVALGCGYSSKAAMPPQAGAMPAITELAPNTMTSGSAGFVLTVNGSDFSSKAVINWNGVAQPTSVVSSSQLTGDHRGIGYRNARNGAGYRHKSGYKRHRNLQHRGNGCRDVRPRRLYRQLI